MKLNKLSGFFVSILIFLTTVGCLGSAAHAANTKDDVSFYVDLCKAKLISEAERHPESADPSRASRDMDACMRDYLNSASTEIPSSTATPAPNPPIDASNNSSDIVDVIGWIFVISLLLFFWFIKAKESSAEKESILASVRKSGDSLKDLSYKYKTDKEIVMAAVKQSGSALQFAEYSEKTDKEIVLAAVKQSGSALQFAEYLAKTDKEIVLAAVKQSGSALQFAEYSEKRDKRIAMAAVKNCHDAFQYVCDELQQDKEIIRAAAGHSKEALEEVRRILNSKFRPIIDLDKIMENQPNSNVV